MRRGGSRCMEGRTQLDAQHYRWYCPVLRILFWSWMLKMGCRGLGLMRAAPGGRHRPSRGDGAQASAPRCGGTAVACLCALNRRGMLCAQGGAEQYRSHDMGAYLPSLIGQCRRGRPLARGFGGRDSQTTGENPCPAMELSSLVGSPSAPAVTHRRDRSGA